MFLALSFVSLLAAATLSEAIIPNGSFNLTSFKIDLNKLVGSTRLPKKALYPNAGPDKGIQLDFLRKLQTEWLEIFDWEAQQAELNQFEQYTAVIEGQTVHFVHEKSDDADAIPVILLHGWPGSFHEFVPVIKPLTQSWKSAMGKKISYNVVVPSLPEFVFSSAPPENWTVEDTARIYNTLMTEVLGYSTFAVHGTDWGCAVGYSLYSSFNTTRLPTIILLYELRFTEWSTIGNSYFTEQANKPDDIGLALYDSPVGQLAWIGGNFKLCTPPSVLNNTAILTSVSLYYLTESFLSSVWIYAQNPNGFRTVYTKADTDAPMLFSQYEYNIGFWPEEYVAKVGNLVSYKVHDFGGHFAGLDNPPALIEDIREMGTYFST
ncbi:Alpha/Beta hydrolase protein [Mycena rosella]|uniref:Alpha/Beta hydrolase protein n=1 Tax=Mycena rosella TaxID=1033263 RepID=A0AAD7G2P8_MYCRO|nr:Alpha/Beta hydrolase protein [Mycena rosella]